MPHVTLDTARYALAENESVLDCLLRHRRQMPHACKAGVCQACLVRATSGVPSAKARSGLKQSLQAGGYALACQWVPDTDVEVKLPGLDEAASAVMIDSIDSLAQHVLRVRLKPAPDSTMFQSRPGQYLNLINPAGISRSYSIANDFDVDGYVELHVASTPHGLFTQWLFNRARPGDTLHARGPAGDCFYVKGDTQDYPIVLAGTGTGLAPLHGIVHDALRQGHRGPMTLLHGGSAPGRLYYVDELYALAQQHPTLSYRPLTLAGPGSDSRIRQGDLSDATLASIDPARLKDTRVFLCGAPEFVNTLRKKVFMKGIKSSHIFCDAFVARPIAA
jgi:CDP-4-dehydro-6-deoxyglucose reductase, E3